MWAQMGKGLRGVNCSPATSPNPVNVFGEPFGHAFVPDLDALIDNCDCFIHDEMISFDVSTLSCCHEVVCNVYNILPAVDGRVYKIVTRVEKGGIQVLYMSYEFTWDNSYSNWQGYFFFGWSPCFWWEGGSDYDPDYVEIYHNGSDYEAIIELWDTVTGLEDEWVSQYFTITGLDHSIIYGDVENYAGYPVDNFGIKLNHYLTGTCGDSTGNVYSRVKNCDSSYIVIVDGMVGSVDVEIYHSGYVIPSQNVIVVEKDINELNFTGTNCLEATLQGIVHDGDNILLPNANVFSERSGGGKKYGCKTNSNGQYALPIHKAGIYNCKAIKNNHVLESQTSGVSQSGDHPSSVKTLNFTGSFKLDRVTGYPMGTYAHLGTIASEVQSLVVLDDPVTDTNLIQPTSIGVSTVKVKNIQTGGAAGSDGTATGPGTEGRGYGTGGFNYDGNMGVAEDWDWEDEILNITNGAVFIDGNKELNCLTIDVGGQSSLHRKRTVGGTWESNFTLTPNDTFTLVNTYKVLYIEALPDRDMVRFIKV